MYVTTYTAYLWKNTAFRIDLQMVLQMGLGRKAVCLYAYVDQLDKFILISITA